MSKVSNATAKKDGAKEKDNRPECKYGAKCYRKQPQHFLEYKHSHKEGNGSVSDSGSNSNIMLADNH